MIRQNQPFVCRLRHLALFAAHVLEYSSALDARKARPARPTGTALWAAFRSVSAQKAPFPLPTPKNLASAVATKEATDEDSNWLRKIISKEIAVAIRSGAVLIRNTASP